MGTIKVVVLTFSVTVAAFAFVASMFLNSVLGVFGLTATGIGAMRALQQSQGMVQKIKDRHADKKSNASRRFVKRTGKRVAATALAAATVGTAAVTVAVIALDVADYCDEQRELQEESDILNATTTTFDTERCIAEARKESTAILHQAQDSVTGAASQGVAMASDFLRERWSVARELIDAAGTATADAALELWGRAGTLLK